MQQMDLLPGRYGLSLNGVRPRRPEQSDGTVVEAEPVETVSMESGLEDRNNGAELRDDCVKLVVSMESGLEDRNNDWAA